MCIGLHVKYRLFLSDLNEILNSKLWVFHPVVFTFNGMLYCTVVTQQYGAMFLLCN